MNSEITRGVIRFSISKIGVLLVNIGTPITRIEGGRNEPRPASEYPHAGTATADAISDTTRRNSRRLVVSIGPCQPVLFRGYYAYETTVRDNRLAHRLSFEMLHHHRIGERDLAELILRRVGCGREACAQRTVDLDRNENLLRFRDALVERRPSSGHDTVGMTEPLPQFLCHVRVERRNHPHQGFH